MPQFEFADYGVIGFFMLIILVTVWKLPEIIKSAKSSPKTEPPKVENKTDKEEKILEGLTTAITKLTVYLETDAAVNKEKEKVLYGNISDIRLSMIKLQENDTEIIRLVKEHSLRCDMSCINKKGE